MNQTKNAKIESTMLGIEDHGIFTCFIHLDYGDSGHQGFGGYTLGGEYGIEFIKNILKIAGVDKWEDLVGQHVRVNFTDKPAGFGYEIKKIGHIIEDKWFEPKKLYEEIKERIGNVE